jgi:pimeloyl-ACP methyl ester carboxylesterase
VSARTRPDPVEVAGATFPPQGHVAEDLTVHTDDGASLATTVVGPLNAGHPTAVLLHGWAGRRATWGLVTRLLANAGTTVVAYDLRGHGASTLGREPIGIARFGRDLATVLDRLELRDVVVAGHSGGGFAAMACATGESAAERIRALALLATAAHDQNTPAPEVALMGSRLLSWATSRRRLGARAMRQTFGRDPGAAELDLVRHLFAATPAAVRGACFRSSRGMDLRAGLATVDVPAVVLTGECDGLVPPRLGRAVAEAMPRARFEELPDVGHMLPIEAPARVAAVVAELSR